MASCGRPRRSVSVHRLAGLDLELCTRCYSAVMSQRIGFLQHLHLIHGRVPWSPMPRHATWYNPRRCSSPHEKTARPSGAHVISYSPGDACNERTLSPGRRLVRRPASISRRSSMSFLTATRKRACC